MRKIAIVFSMLLFGNFAFAGNQVFYRFGSANVHNDRAGEIFADTAGANGLNNGDSGTSIGAGLDLELFNCPLFEKNSLVGEVFINYVKYSEEQVASAASVLAAADTSKKEVDVSELAVTIAPKYKFNLGKFKPWIIPVGLSFLVNSPPSNTTNYLDIGLHVGAGIEYEIVKQMSLGVDVRYTTGAGDPVFKFQSTDVAAYIGINF